MGIGEPLHNFNNVMDFLEIISCPEGVNIGMRNISLSTCGLVPKIDELAKRHLQLTLSVSLHAPDNKTRSGMMPVNDAFPLEQLIPACRRYQKETGRRISFEYSMVRGVNDSSEMAQKLANLIKGMGAHVNLIPINPVDGSLILPPTMPMCTASRRSWRHWASTPRCAAVWVPTSAPPAASCAARTRRENESCSATEQRKGTNPNEDCRDHRHRQLRQETRTITVRSSWQAAPPGASSATAWAVSTAGALLHALPPTPCSSIFARHMKALQPGMEKTFIMRGFDITNRAVYEKSTSDPEMQGMGTTGVCAYASRGMAHVVHAGDSRATCSTQAGCGRSPATTQWCSSSSTAARSRGSRLPSTRRRTSSPARSASRPTLCRSTTAAKSRRGTSCCCAPTA